MRLRDRLAALAPDRRRQILGALSDAEIAALAYDWTELHARDDQLPPAGDWGTWLVLAGRGWGKTRVGAEWVRMIVASRRAGRLALVAPTASDARDVMVEGDSGLLSVHPNVDRPIYEPSKRRLTWPNGAIGTLYSAEEPDRLRGPQHDAAWADELAAWQYTDTWDMLQFGLRLGQHPQQIVTTTPRPTRQLRQLMADPRTVITKGRTLDNAANLAPSFITAIQARYAGTRLGRQELDAEILDDNPAALWQRSQIDACRVSAAPLMRRVVVAIDPAVTNNPDSDETGIIVAGLGQDGRGYVLADLTCKDSPAGWARRAVQAYRHYQADRIVAEANQGGDLIEGVIRGIDERVSYQSVRASRGKFSRAEPVAALYEQGRVSHVGCHSALEDQMCDYDPESADRSPDRMDALVWAITALMLHGDQAKKIQFNIMSR